MDRLEAKRELWSVTDFESGEKKMLLHESHPSNSDLSKEQKTMIQRAGIFDLQREKQPLNSFSDKTKMMIPKKRADSVVKGTNDDNENDEEDEDFVKSARNDKNEDDFDEEDLRAQHHRELRNLRRKKSQDSRNWRRQRERASHRHLRYESPTRDFTSGDEELDSLEHERRQLQQYKLEHQRRFEMDPRSRHEEYQHVYSPPTESFRRGGYRETQRQEYFDRQQQLQLHRRQQQQQQQQQQQEQEEEEMINLIEDSSLNLIKFEADYVPQPWGPYLSRFAIETTITNRFDDVDFKNANNSSSLLISECVPFYTWPCAKPSLSETSSSSFTAITKPSIFHCWRDAMLSKTKACPAFLISKEMDTKTLDVKLDLFNLRCDVQSCHPSVVPIHLRRPHLPRIFIPTRSKPREELEEEEEDNVNQVIRYEEEFMRQQHNLKTPSPHTISTPLQLLMPPTSNAPLSPASQTLLKDFNLENQTKSNGLSPKNIVHNIERIRQDEFHQQREEEEKEKQEEEEGKEEEEEEEEQTETEDEKEEETETEEEEEEEEEEEDNYFHEEHDNFGAHRDYFHKQNLESIRKRFKTTTPTRSKVKKQTIFVEELENKKEDAEFACPDALTDGAIISPLVPETSRESFSRGHDRSLPILRSEESAWSRLHSKENKKHERAVDEKKWSSSPSVVHCKKQKLSHVPSLSPKKLTRPLQQLQLPHVISSLLVSLSDYLSNVDMYTQGAHSYQCPGEDQTEAADKENKKKLLKAHSTNLECDTERPKYFDNLLKKSTETINLRPHFCILPQNLRHFVVPFQNTTSHDLLLICIFNSSTTCKVVRSCTTTYVDVLQQNHSLSPYSNPCLKPRALDGMSNSGVEMRTLPVVCETRQRQGSDAHFSHSQPGTSKIILPGLDVDPANLPSYLSGEEQLHLFQVEQTRFGRGTISDLVFIYVPLLNPIQEASKTASALLPSSPPLDDDVVGRPAPSVSPSKTASQNLSRPHTSQTGDTGRGAPSNDFCTSSSSERAPPQFTSYVMNRPPSLSSVPSGSFVSCPSDAPRFPSRPIPAIQSTPLLSFNTPTKDDQDSNKESKRPTLDYDKMFQLRKRTTQVLDSSSCPPLVWKRNYALPLRGDITWFAYDSQSLIQILSLFTNRLKMITQNAVSMGSLQDLES